jgi:hypothetical protein
MDDLESKRAAAKALWSGLSFDETEIVSQALAILNNFEGFIYVLGGLALFSIIMLVLIGVVNKSRG